MDGWMGAYQESSNGNIKAQTMCGPKQEIMAFSPTDVSFDYEILFASIQVPFLLFHAIYIVANECQLEDTWSEWTSCSVICGGGVRSRSGSLTPQGNCEGTITQEEKCNDFDCPPTIYPCAREIALTLDI